MAVYDQQKGSYSDTTPHIRVIGDIIHLIDPVDTPLIVALGGLNTARNKFDLRLNGTKIELLEDAYDPVETTANQGTTISTSATVITVADASIFQDGHVIQMGDEYAVVKSADVATEKIVVYSRTYGGTNSTHVTGVAVSIVGMARLEGDDADYGPLVDITAPFNYSSIFQKAINISGTQQVLDQYGIDNEFMYQANKNVPHLMRLLNRAAYHGVRSVGTATAPRSFGGLGTFITDNTVDAGGTIVKADVDSLMEEIHMDGGSPDLLVMSPRVANDLRNLLDSSSFVRMTQENSVLGMREIDKVRTQYGDLQIVMDRWCPTDTAFVLDSSKIGYYTLRPFAAHELARTGDSLKGETLFEGSLLVANDKAHGKITGITT